MGRMGPPRKALLLMQRMVVGDRIVPEALVDESRHLAVTAVARVRLQRGIGFREIGLQHAKLVVGGTPLAAGAADFGASVFPCGQRGVGLFEQFFVFFAGCRFNLCIVAKHWILPPSCWL